MYPTLYRQEAFPQIWNLHRYALLLGVAVIIVINFFNYCCCIKLNAVLVFRGKVGNPLGQVPKSKICISQQIGVYTLHCPLKARIGLTTVGVQRPSFI